MKKIDEFSRFDQKESERMSWDYKFVQNFLITFYNFSIYFQRKVKKNLT